MPSSPFWKKTNGKRTNSLSIYFNTESFVYVTTSHGTYIGQVVIFSVQSCDNLSTSKNQRQKKILCSVCTVDSPQRPTAGYHTILRRIPYIGRYASKTHNTQQQHTKKNKGGNGKYLGLVHLTFSVHHFVYFNPQFHVYDVTG